MVCGKNKRMNNKVNNRKLKRSNGCSSLPTTNYKLQTNSGFTLIEVLIVVAITSLLSGMVLTYSSKGRSQVALYVESAKLSQVILRAKSLAIATYGEAGTPCGYGVHIDYAAKSYSLFSYNPGVNDCGKIDQGAIETGNPAFYMVKPGETYTLSPGLEYKFAVGDQSFSDILFLPPDPTTLIWRVGGAVPFPDAISSVTIIVGADPLSASSVRVSPSGQVAFGTVAR